MLVQVTEGAELGMAEITLVGAAVPRSTGGDVRGCAITVGQEARGVGNNVSPVHPEDVAVNCASVDSRMATAVFAVEDEGRIRDKGLSTTLDVTYVVGSAMDP